MRLRIIANPVASSMTPARLAHLREALSPGNDVDVVTTAGRGDARTLAVGAVTDGIDVVVVAAGDGTLNEAASGLLGTTTAIAAWPGGSTNVFARAVGIGNRPGPAGERIARAIATGRIRRIGVGRITAHAAPGSTSGPDPDPDSGSGSGSGSGFDDRCFLFHLGAGFDAAVVARMEARPRSQRVKRYAAHPAFALATVATLARHDRRRAALEVEAPGHPVHPSFFTVVSNLAPYSFVGPRRMLLTADAGLDRALAVTSLRRFGWTEVARTFGSAVGRARHLSHSPAVVQWHDVASVTIRSRTGDPFPCQVDGDHLGSFHRLSLRHEPAALAAVLPD